jgi:hypothetical protein
MDHVVGSFGATTRAKMIESVVKPPSGWSEHRVRAEIVMRIVREMLHSAAADCGGRGCPIAAPQEWVAATSSVLAVLMRALKRPEAARHSNVDLALAVLMLQGFIASDNPSEVREFGAVAFNPSAAGRYACGLGDEECHSAPLSDERVAGARRALEFLRASLTEADANRILNAIAFGATSGLARARMPGRAAAFEIGGEAGAFESSTPADADLPVVRALAGSFEAQPHWAWLGLTP